MQWLLQRARKSINYFRIFLMLKTLERITFMSHVSWVCSYESDNHKKYALPWLTCDKKPTFLFHLSNTAVTEAGKWVMSTMITVTMPSLRELTEVVSHEKNKQNSVSAFEESGMNQLPSLTIQQSWKPFFCPRFSPPHSIMYWYINIHGWRSAAIDNQPPISDDYSSTLLINNHSLHWSLAPHSLITNQHMADL